MIKHPKTTIAALAAACTAIGAALADGFTVDPDVGIIVTAIMVAVLGILAHDGE